MKKLIALLIFVILPLLLIFMPEGAGGRRSTDNSSIGVAPHPDSHKEAMVQVYVAREDRWAGRVMTRSWIATKQKNAASYTVYQVIEGKTNGTASLRITKDLPDRKWYGHAPDMIFHVKGRDAEAMIPKIREAALAYPDQKIYRRWPGPNSNSFTAYVMRQVPGFYVELPATAIGKDWMNDGRIFGKSTTGTGVTMSLYGVLGFTIGWSEGFELNVLGMTYGFDVLRPALKLPYLGRIGVPDQSDINVRALMNERAATLPSVHRGQYE